MAEFKLNFDDLDPSQHLAEEFELAQVEGLEALGAARRALDSAANSRTGVLLIGPKGSGKTHAVEGALEWFDELEREKRRLDSTYVRRRILEVPTVHGTSYWNTAVRIAEALNPRYQARKRGLKKDKNKILEEVTERLLKAGRSVIVVDEAEECTDETIQFFRDLIAEAEKKDPKRRESSGARKAAGIGVLLAGTDDLAASILSSEEAGQRWSQKISVDRPTADHLPQIYDTWFPGFGTHVEAVGRAAWTAYLSSTIARGRKISLHVLTNHARLYVLYMVRRYQSIRSAEAIPFEQGPFEAAYEQVAWGSNKGNGGRRRG